MLNNKQAYLTKVFIQIFLRNKQYIVFSLILPIVILSIVGLNDGKSDPIDIGLVDNSDSTLSQSFIEKLSTNSIFNVIEDSEKNLKADLINGDLMLILVLPADIEDRNKTTNIKLLVDKSQVQFIETIKPILNQSLLSIEREITQEVAMFDLLVEDVKSRSQSYIDFLLPGIMAFMLMNLSIAGSGFNVVEFRRRGILKRLFVTPIKPIDFVSAIVLARMVIVLGQLTIIFGFALFALDANILGSILSLYLVIMFGILMFLTLGFSIGSLAKTQESVGVLATIFIYPQLVLSGVFFPLETLPEYIQPFAQLLPLSLVADAMRSIASDGAALVEVYKSIIGIGVWIGIGTLISTKLFVWKEVAG
ncbi:ABC transporter permease [Gammaproteobacteria bacterium]|nr:ABC transporter permease [Gammaproteobacteria bacterium]MDB9997449.1 ABC transporter permease [Gammaproteobacteria bacterium]